MKDRVIVAGGKTLLFLKYLDLAVVAGLPLCLFLILASEGDWMRGFYLVQELMLLLLLVSYVGNLMGLKRKYLHKSRSYFLAGAVLVVFLFFKFYQSSRGSGFLNIFQVLHIALYVWYVAISVADIGRIKKMVRA